MGRPVKEGLDYFPLDVTLSGSVEYIRCMYGKMGEAVIISLWQRIYAHSYYIEYNQMSPLVFSQEFGAQLEACFPKKEKQGFEIYDEIVKKAVEFGVFDEKLFKEYGILTSARIQSYYLKAKKTDATERIDERYLLLSVPEKGIDDAETGVFDAETPVLEETIPQSKVKESRGKKNKINESRGKEDSAHGAPSIPTSPIEAYEALIGRASSAVKRELAEFINGGVEEALIVRLIEYAAENGKTSRAYIRAAIKGNMQAGITTLEAYNHARAKRAAAAKRGKLNNYTDTNKPDYTNFSEQILNDILNE